MLELNEKIRGCNGRRDLVRINLFANLTPDHKEILNEVAFYSHNGGYTITNELFENYLVISKNPKLSAIDASQFKGRGPKSFLNFIIEKEAKKNKGHSQMINFIDNDNGPEAQKLKTPGRNSSTRSNLRVLKNYIDRWRKNLSKETDLEKDPQKLSLKKQQLKLLNEFKSDAGFKQKCSAHLPK